MLEKLYEYPAVACCKCGDAAIDDGFEIREDALLCVHCVRKERELLRIGMSGGRALIKTRPSPKPRKDTQTLSMFDTELTLF